jgi:hypothetical protein
MLSKNGIEKHTDLSDPISDPYPVMVFSTQSQVASNVRCSHIVVDLEEAQRDACKSVRDEIRSAMRLQTLETLQTSFPLLLKRIGHFILECPGSRPFRFRGCEVVILRDVLVVSTDFLSKFLESSGGVDKSTVLGAGKKFFSLHS